MFDRADTVESTEQSLYSYAKHPLQFLFFERTYGEIASSRG